MCGGKGCTSERYGKRRTRHEMIRILQANMRRMCSARSLLNQAARETRADVLIISEQPKGPPDNDKSFFDLHSSAQLVWRPRT